MKIVRFGGAFFCFVWLLCGQMLLPCFALGQAPTAGEAWSRIQHRYADPASSQTLETVDTLKGGDPSTAVTGIATTFLDTMDVLREAARRGDNLVITHEPTFYNHRDEVKDFVNDPVYKQKLAFIEQHHLVVYRLHDAIHADPAGDHILAGLYEELGWQNYAHPPGDFGAHIVAIPPTTLVQLARWLRVRLHARTLRVEGDPDLAVRHAAVLPGASGLTKQVFALNQPQVDVLIAGEASEWEAVEYVRDAVAQGRPMGLVLLGHEVSEEPGMERCARELRTLFPGMRVEHLRAGQPLWDPEHPPRPTR